MLSRTVKPEHSAEWRVLMRAAVVGPGGCRGSRVRGVRIARLAAALRSRSLAVLESDIRNGTSVRILDSIGRHVFSAVCLNDLGPALAHGPSVC